MMAAVVPMVTALQHDEETNAEGEDRQGPDPLLVIVVGG